MRSTFAAILAVVLFGAAGFAPGSELSAQAGGSATTFDAAAIMKWNKVGDANWEIVDGAVQATKGMNSYLVSPMSYGDFQMTLEVWVSDDANSGVFIRCQDPKNITAMNAYEVNIYDKRPDQTYRTGAIVDVAKPLVTTINAGGRWSTLDITAQGTKLIVVMNGMKTVDVDHKGHARGPIALQYGMGSTTVRFRNVRIRTL
jgi:hypothetical protein